MFLLIALNLFSRTAVFALEAIDFLCFWSLADILNFPLLLCPHFFATTVTKAFIKSQLISEFQSRKFRLETLFRQFPMPMAKPVRTDNKMGTHIGSIICWLFWLWISSSVAIIFINRRWLSESLFKVLQIRFLFGSQNYAIYGYHIRRKLSSFPIIPNWTFPICSKIFFHFSYSGQINSIGTRQKIRTTNRMKCQWVVSNVLEPFWIWSAT